MAVKSTAGSSVAGSYTEDLWRSTLLRQEACQGEARSKSNRSKASGSRSAREYGSVVSSTRSRLSNILNEEVLDPSCNGREESVYSSSIGSVLPFRGIGGTYAMDRSPISARLRRLQRMEELEKEGESCGAAQKPFVYPGMGPPIAGMASAWRGEIERAKQERLTQQAIQKTSELQKPEEQKAALAAVIDASWRCKVPQQPLGVSGPIPATLTTAPDGTRAVKRPVNLENIFCPPTASQEQHVPVLMANTAHQHLSPTVVMTSPAGKKKMGKGRLAPRPKPPCEISSFGEVYRQQYAGDHPYSTDGLPFSTGAFLVGGKAPIGTYAHFG
eukprot:TRINITY_DN42880_c0_g1_i1.p1 TRINITY_DN42880_c0_g1~~TRINITY_DN42880_c0_g1_i1.p1  ORF type:complete len:345 (+),score=49.30 TRINITY_DN42880_c0_g1_i1:49-1035(+)